MKRYTACLPSTRRGKDNPMLHTLWQWAELPLAIAGVISLLSAVVTLPLMLALAKAAGKPVPEPE
jgi:hypothetical protein